MSQSDNTPNAFPPGFIPFPMPTLYPFTPQIMTMEEVRRLMGSIGGAPTSQIVTNDIQEDEIDQPKFVPGQQVVAVDVAPFEDRFDSGHVYTIRANHADGRLVSIAWGTTVPGAWHQWYAADRFVAMEVFLDKLNPAEEPWVQEHDNLLDRIDELKDENEGLKEELIVMTERVQNLLDANNAEVERRRAAEANLAELQPLVQGAAMTLLGLMTERLSNAGLLS